jgi:hypothetical protein
MLHACRAEQALAQEGLGVGTVAAPVGGDCVAHDARNDVRGAARVAPHVTGPVVER